MKRYITYCLGSILAVLLAVSPAVAVEYNVSAKGKNKNIAEANAKVNAVRACMKELVTMDFLQANADTVIFEIIMKSGEFVTSCNILEHKQDDTFTSIQAVVDVDKDRLKEVLLSLQRKALFNVIDEGNKDKLTELIKQGYSLEVRNDRGETPVQLAVRYGHWILATILVDAGADINVHDNEGRTLLMVALSKYIDSKNLDMLAAKLKNYTALDNSNRSILHYAAASGFIENIEFALKHFKDIELRDINGNTALSVSQYKTNQYLIANGADPCVVNNNGRDRASVCKTLYDTTDSLEKIPFIPLNYLLNPSDNREFDKLSEQDKIYYRIDNNSLSQDILKELVTSGGDVNYQTRQGELLLNRAAARYSEGYDLVLFLLSHGADINKVDFNGQSALFHAIKEGNKKTVDLLIERGISVNLQDRLGQTPLFYAAANGNVEIAQLLISKGANVHTRSKLGETALFWAAFGRKKRSDKEAKEMVTLLLNAGAKAHEISNARLTPLWCAIFRENFDTAKLLIEHGAEVNYKTHHRIIDPALRDANFVSYLIKKGTDVNTTVTADSGWTGPARNMNAPLLYWAVQNNHTDLVKIILSHNVEIDRRAENGETALLLAVNENNKTMVDLLLNAGANTQIPRNDGQTPLIRAAKNCKVAMVKRLIAAGATITDEDFDKFITKDININWMKKNAIYADLLSVKQHKMEPQSN